VLRPNIRKDSLLDALQTLTTVYVISSPPNAVAENTILN